jgi:erythromycin esterase
MKNKLILLFLTVFLISNTVIGQTVENELKKILIPIKSTDPNMSVDDLLPIRKYLKNKKIISVGEANHGAKEFFEMKHRMVQLLVEKMDVKAIAFEINPAAAFGWNNYIQNGIGDVDKLLGEEAWVWNTNEIKEMLVWLKTTNAKKKPSEKVTFYGFDVQDVDKSARFINNFVIENKLNISPNIGELLSVLSETRYFNFSTNFPEPKLIEAKKNLAELSKLLKSKNQTGYKNADYILWSLMSGMEAFSAGSGRSIEKLNIVRDRFMAENVGKIVEKLEGKNSKLLLLAHNAHIAKAVDKDEYGLNYKSCGQLLAEKYGAKYYAIGTDSNKGKSISLVRGQGFTEIDVETEEKNTTGNVHSKTNIPIFFYDIKTASANHITKPFISDSSILMRVFAEVYDSAKRELMFDKGSLQDNYDAIIFVNKVSSANSFLPKKGTVVQELNYKSKKGAKYKLEANIKIVKSSKEAAAEIYIIIVPNDSRKEAKRKAVKIDIQNLHDWKTYQLEFDSESDLGSINIGIAATDEFKVLFDDFKVFEQKDGNRFPIDFPNFGFDEFDKKENRPRLWYANARSPFFKHYVEKEGDNNYGVIEIAKK